MRSFDRVRVAESLLGIDKSEDSRAYVGKWLESQGLELPSDREMQLHLALGLLECNDLEPEHSESPKRRRLKSRKDPLAEP